MYEPLSLWVYTLFILVFKLYKSARTQIISALTSALSQNGNEAIHPKSKTSHHNHTAGLTLIGLCLDSGESCEREDSFSSTPISDDEVDNNALILHELSLYSHLLEDALHHTVNISIPSVHALSFALVNVAPFRLQHVKSEMTIFIRKQLFSGQDHSVRIGLIATSHLLHVQNVLSDDELRGLFDWVLQFAMDADFDPNIPFVLDLLLHNASRLPFDLTRRAFCEYIQRVASDVKMMSFGAGEPHDDGRHKLKTFLFFRFDSTASGNASANKAIFSISDMNSVLEPVSFFKLQAVSQLLECYVVFQQLSNLIGRIPLSEMMKFGYRHIF